MTTTPERRLARLAPLLLITACADRAPPARFPDAEPPAMAKPIEPEPTDAQGERGADPSSAGGSTDAPSGEPDAPPDTPYAETEPSPDTGE